MDTKSSLEDMICRPHRPISCRDMKSYLLVIGQFLGDTLLVSDVRLCLIVRAICALGGGNQEGLFKYRLHR